jgi:DNA (cytosine-5)-methyltransferase 1
MGLADPMFGYLCDDIGCLASEDEKEALQHRVKRARKSFGLVGFIGGPPCPDFSVGGKNKGREGKNGVLSETYVDIICAQKPDFFVFENVKGLWRTKRHREFYEELKQKLVSTGYSLTERLINSIEFGVAQDRDRIILTGFRSTIPWASKVAGHFPWSRYTKFDRELLKNENWPARDDFEEKGHRPKPKSVPLELTVQYWFDRNQVNKHPNAQDQFVPRAALPRFKVIDEGDDSKKCFKRLHRWRYSPTAAYGNNEVHLHPYLPRRISVAEALAIQSLPSEFMLPPDMTLSDKFKTIGNGVPFEAARGVAMAVRDFLKEDL